MDNTVEKFDPSTLMQGVKDRIKSTFVSLIPDDQWDSMVQKEIDAFFNEEKKITIKEEEKGNDFWARKRYLVTATDQTPFRAIVWGHCIDLTFEVLKEKISLEYFKTQYISNQPELTDKMEELITLTSAAGAAKFFESMTHGMMSHLQSTLQGMR